MSRKRLVIGLTAVVVLAVVAVVAIFIVRASRGTVEKSSEAPAHLVYLTQADISHISSPLARKVLADGRVSREELQSVKAEYVACLTKNGFTGISVGDRGDETYTPPAGMASDDEIQQLDGRCLGAGWGAVSQEYTAEHPSSADDAQAKFMLACLKRQGSLPKDYTMGQYNAAVIARTWAFPFPKNDAGYLKCGQEEQDLVRSGKLPSV